MAEKVYLIKESTLTEIAEEIRANSGGGNKKIDPKNMREEISNVARINYSNGESMGLIQGEATGYANGLAAGKIVGYQEAKDEFYQRRYDEGHQEGYQEGIREMDAWVQTVRESWHTDIYYSGHGMDDYQTSITYSYYYIDANLNLINNTETYTSGSGSYIRALKGSVFEIDKEWINDSLFYLDTTNLQLLYSDYSSEYYLVK